MRTRLEVTARLRQYTGARVIYHDWGYIAWQVSTGENVEEILFEVGEKNKGRGKQLWRELCQQLVAEGLPYHSVFMYHLKANEAADHFYNSLGFARYEIPDLYRGDVAVLRVLPFITLRARIGV